MGMGLYSFLLAVGLGVSAPWWAWRMATSGRYRVGLGGRLGRVPAALRAAVEGKRVVWVHAVSVGEVLAAARLVGELGGRLDADSGAGWVVVVSTTTATGQTVARERFGAGRVFYFPLDFGWVVRRYLRALRPELMVLVESELWPRLLGECEREGVPVAVVNARMSDRSFGRAMRVRRVWGWMGRRVGLWLAQGQETAGRLRELGVEAGRIRMAGNLKYDAPATEQNRVASAIRDFAYGHKIVVAGSTLAGEEKVLLGVWSGIVEQVPGAVLVLAPRHPPRFEEVARMIGDAQYPAGSVCTLEKEIQEERMLIGEDGYVLELDTLGDLATVYGVATVAFVGGSLVGMGGHNPLEAARFGVPVVMGPSYENFREIVEGMRASKAIRIVDSDGLEAALVQLLKDDGGMGERGRRFYEGQAGATGRTVAALMELIGA